VTNNQHCKVWLKQLWKQTGTTKKFVAYMLITQYRNTPTEYYCVLHPASSASVEARFWQSLQDKQSIYAQAKARLIIYPISTQLKWLL
jgi:hypothetical protein